jgi:hypothetical protein
VYPSTTDRPNPRVRDEGLIKPPSIVILETFLKLSLFGYADIGVVSTYFRSGPLIMSEKGQEPKLDVSMWPDSRLRPWTIDDELEAKIDDENLSLDDRVLKTSGSKLAGMV